MAIQSTRVLIRTDSFIVRQSLWVTCMTAMSAIRFFWVMRPPFYADAAYSSKETRDKLERFGIADQVQRKGYRNQPLSEQDSRRNDAIAVIRAGGERSFAIYKNRYGLARTQFLGLAKNMSAYGIAAIGHSLLKGVKFLTISGLPNQTYNG